MRIVDPLLMELEQEAATTRRVLERVPEAHLGFKPHPTSMSLGQLALHVAQTPGAVARLVSTDVVDPPAFVQPMPANHAQIMDTLGSSVAHAREALDGWSDERMMATFSIVAGGKAVMSAPRVGVVRAIMLNHWYHHRGQLLVYLRMLGVKVPSVYGPTADESPFM